VVSTEEDVLAGSKSSYYPVELSEVVRHMMKVPGRYAVVGLPCVCKAIRNAQIIIPKLDRRIEYLFGLVCVGQQANTNYSKAIAEIAGLEGELASIRFREKKKESPLPNMLFSVRNSNGELAYASFFGGVKTMWASGAFRLSGCNYCDDAFAECADVAFMDAWLPEYEDDSIGYNIVLSRKEELSKLLEEIHTLTPIAIEQVVRSQAVHTKRTALSTRLFVGRCLGQFAPRKRVSPQISSLKDFVKTILQSNRYKASRKNLAAGKSYDALRLETLPFVAIQQLGALGSRIIRNISK
jgi:coenzyme F420-reducing hydrogenase beta subunit